MCGVVPSSLVFACCLSAPGSYGIPKLPYASPPPSTSWLRGTCSGREPSPYCSRLEGENRLRLSRVDQEKPAVRRTDPLSTPEVPQSSSLKHIHLPPTFLRRPGHSSRGAGPGPACGGSRTRAAALPERPGSSRLLPPPPPAEPSGGLGGGERQWWTRGPGSSRRFNRSRGMGRWSGAPNRRSLGACRPSQGGERWRRGSSSSTIREQLWGEGIRR